MAALKHVLVKVEMDVISIPLGHHVVQHVALEPKQEQLPTLVPISLLLKLKSVPIPKDIMAHGLAGLFAVLHVAVDTKHVANLTHVAVKIMSKRELVTKIPDIMVPGVNGVLALLHVVVVMLCVNVFTGALERFRLIPNSVTHIHVHIMVLGLTGHHAVHHVALEPCLDCDIVMAAVLVTVFASMVTCQPTKLPNVTWAPAVILIGLDGLDVVEIPEIKMSACDSVEDAPELPLRKFPSHVTALVLLATPVWSSFKTLSNLDSSMAAIIQPTLSILMNL